ncbi:MAG: PAS domain S-box protein [Candidatus Omnitrophota bacterium]
MKEILVLLVEDNPDDALLINEMLGEMILTTVRVNRSETLSDAIGLLRNMNNKRPPDVVLLDLNLPDSQGMNSVTQMSRHASHVPIVVLTGMGDEEMGRHAIQLGAQDYICKNQINPNVLENCLRFAIERHRLYAQLENKKSLLQKSEERLRRIIEHNADGIIIAKTNGVVKFANPAAEKLLTGNRARDFFGSANRLIELMRKYACISQDFLELNLAEADDDPLIVEIRVKEIDWEGEDAYLAALRDITERKQLERSLIIEKEKLDITLRSIAEGVIATDNNGRVLSYNTMAAQMVGLTSQATGMFLDHIVQVDGFTSEKGEFSEDLYYGSFDRPAPGDNSANPENRLTIEYSRAPILGKYKQVKGYVFVLRDVTAQKKRIEEKEKSLKLESIGLTAKRLAQDFDHLFNEVRQQIAEAKTGLAPESEVFQMLEKAEQKAQSADALTQRLLTFSRNGSV